MAGEQWYLAIGGQQVGPMSEADVVQGIQAGTVDAKTLVFSAGMSNWTPLAAVAPVGSAPGRRWQRCGGPLAFRLCRRVRPTRSTSRSTATRCSSSRCTWTLARAPWLKPAR